MSKPRLAIAQPISGDLHVRAVSITNLSRAFVLKAYQATIPTTLFSLERYADVANVTKSIADLTLSFHSVQISPVLRFVRVLIAPQVSHLKRIDEIKLVPDQEKTLAQ